jgi:hypothetical protein
VALVSFVAFHYNFCEDLRELKFQFSPISCLCLSFFGMTAAVSTRQTTNLDEISVQINQMLTQSTSTEERLAKLERLRALESAKEKSEPTHRRPSFGGTPARSRPPPSDFQVSRRKGVPTSKDVTVDQIFECLKALREEIADLTTNHDEMVGQINAIKRLIQ